MQIYMVGGAVRDALLGLPVSDHDWVVVGATPEEMIEANYLPVGKDFPVFLHPQTKEEYALARTERKTARGYHGIAFHTDAAVTLEEDLARRDLTVNAIAQDEDGLLIDPYNGQADIEKRVLRHVTNSFREDPVRILRLARFAARFADFSVAPETMDLMRGMVKDGEVDALVPGVDVPAFDVELIDAETLRVSFTGTSEMARAAYLALACALSGVHPKAIRHVRP